MSSGEVVFRRVQAIARSDADRSSACRNGACPRRGVAKPPVRPHISMHTAPDDREGYVRRTILGVCGRRRFLRCVAGRTHPVPRMRALKVMRFMAGSGRSPREAPYDRIGLGYTRFRKPDPRIEARIASALSNSRTVVNVGAGTGSYEPTDRVVVAVEPSAQMIKQRAPEAAPCIRATAERLPFSDRSFDAAMGILTIHHWSDPVAGLRELVRVARRVIVFAYEPTIHRAFWLWQEYFPAAATTSGASELPIERVAEIIGADRVESVLVPHDCSDGFGPAYWRRPAAYLDLDVRSCISGLARLPEQDVHPGLERLRQDLSSDAWQTRHQDLLNRDALDAGLRLVVRDGTG